MNRRAIWISGWRAGWAPFLAVYACSSPWSVWTAFVWLVVILNAIDGVQGWQESRHERDRENAT